MRVRHSIVLLNNNNNNFINLIYTLDHTVLSITREEK